MSCLIPKTIYFAYLPNELFVEVMLPKKRGDGFLKSPCSRMANRNDELTNLVDAILDPISFEGEMFVLSLSYIRVQSAEVMQRRLEQLAEIYYQDDCQVIHQSWDDFKNHIQKKEY